MNINENILKNDERVALRLRDLYRSYGFAQYKMSKFEEYDLYARNKDFLVSDNVITFTDTNGKLMALKPDVTLSIVKNTKDEAGLHKVYYDENVYRISGSSRAYREIMQTGLECIGDIDDYAITEVLMLAAESLSRISDDYVLDISELDVVSAVIEQMGVSEEKRAALIAAVTFVICLGGILIGRKVGTRLAGKAGILGGAILIFIGLQIFIKSFIA